MAGYNGLLDFPQFADGITEDAVGGLHPQQASLEMLSPNSISNTKVRKMKSFYIIDKVSSWSHLLSNSLVYYDLTESPEVGLWEMLPLNSIFELAC